jgi:hypothetical protein
VQPAHLAAGAPSEEVLGGTVVILIDVAGSGGRTRSSTALEANHTPDFFAAKAKVMVKSMPAVNLKVRSMLEAPFASSLPKPPGMAKARLEVHRLVNASQLQGRLTPPGSFKPGTEPVKPENMRYCQLA